MEWGGSVARPCQLPGGGGQGEQIWTTAPKQRQNVHPEQGLWVFFRSESMDSTILILTKQD